MVIGDWTKLITVLLITVAASVLGFFGKLDSQAVAALLSACLGYVFGNSHGILSSSHTSKGGGNNNG